MIRSGLIIGDIRMRKITTALMSATALVSLPAMAQDGGFYIGLGAGVLSAEDTTLEQNDVVQIDIDNDYGWEGEGVIGYDAGLLRFEVEGSYKNWEFDSMTSDLRVPASFAPDGSVQLSDPAQTEFDPIGGNAEVWSGMLNILLDLGGEGNGFGAAVGGGVGVSNVRILDLQAFSTGDYIIEEDNDVRFAWQAIAQIYAPITDRIDASLKYRYHNVEGLSFTDTLGRDFDSQIGTHSVLGTFIYNFGGDETPPPPAASPAGGGGCHARHVEPPSPTPSPRGRGFAGRSGLRSRQVMQGRSRHRNGRRIPRIAGPDGRLLRPRRGPRSASRRRDPRSLQASGAGRRCADRSGDGGGVAGG
ncbi:conserved exported hypothetical protein [Erythrobacter sp. EC-HK427]|nr:conserved exported hypothetical protein [Erythrobacter sp. EC-HK427]